MTCSLRTNRQTDRQTDRQTEVLKTENPIRASAFQASACDLSGPINNVSKRVMKYTHYTLSDPDSVTRLAVKGKHTYLSSRPE